MEIDDICVAGVAAIMGKNPNIVVIDGVKDEVVLLSYARDSDGTRWGFKCKVAGNRIIWGNADGRWRTHKLDSAVYYQIKGDKVDVRERHSDSSSSTDSYLLDDVRRP
ncbi:hypothetical protein P8631_00380 [Guyparkeria sp. 1SP6A2]|nr:hypothetical protein [Guyparkeria sp. 1SP6A2]